MGNGRIAMSYSEMEGAKAQIASESGEMDGSLADLRTQLENLDWRGSDRDSYDEAKAQWDSSYAKILDILNAVSNAVGNAMERYQATEAANAGRFGV